MVRTMQTCVRVRERTIETVRLGWSDGPASLHEQSSMLRGPEITSGKLLQKTSILMNLRYSSRCGRQPCVQSCFSNKNSVRVLLLLSVHKKVKIPTAYASVIEKSRKFLVYSF